MVTLGPTAARTASIRVDVDHRIVMADLELQAAEAVMLDGAPALVDQRLSLAIESQPISVL